MLAAVGTCGLERLRGMFAFAIYDEPAAALTLVRDPLGIKPIYVMPRGRGVLFASELKAMVAAVGPELTIDPAALVASTLFYFLPDEQCAFKGVLQTPAGILGGVADRRNPRRTLLGARRRSHGGGGRPDPPIWAPSSKNPSLPTWWLTYPWRPFSAEAWTPA